MFSFDLGAAAPACGHCMVLHGMAWHVTAPTHTHTSWWMGFIENRQAMHHLLLLVRGAQVHKVR